MDDFALRSARPRHVTMVHERRPVPFEPAPREAGEGARDRPLAEFELVRVRPALVPVEDEDDGFGVA